MYNSISSSIDSGFEQSLIWITLRIPIFGAFFFKVISVISPSHRSISSSHIERGDGGATWGSRNMASHGA